MYTVRYFKRKISNLIRWPNVWVLVFEPVVAAADPLQDGEVSGQEFMKAIQNNCMGKSYADLPKAFKAFIDGYFKTVDVDGNAIMAAALIGEFSSCKKFNLKRPFFKFSVFFLLFSSS